MSVNASLPYGVKEFKIPKNVFVTISYILSINRGWEYVSEFIIKKYAVVEQSTVDGINYDLYVVTNTELRVFRKVEEKWLFDLILKLEGESYDESKTRDC